MIIIICISIMILSSVALYNAIIEIKIIKKEKEIKNALKKAEFSYGPTKGHYLTIAEKATEQVKFLKSA